MWNNESEKGRRGKQRLMNFLAKRIIISVWKMKGRERQKESLVLCCMIYDIETTVKFLPRKKAGDLKQELC
jgi:hypothetical protein